MPALTEPRSPVTSYQQPAIRGPLVNSALLPACSAGVALPVDDTPASQRNVATLVTALKQHSPTSLPASYLRAARWVPVAAVPALAWLTYL